MMEGKWTAIIWRLKLWNWRNKTVHENNFYGFMLEFQSNHYKAIRENWTSFDATIILHEYVRAIIAVDVMLLKLASKYET